jgi:hypothetical protein
MPWLPAARPPDPRAALFIRHSRHTSPDTRHGPQKERSPEQPSAPKVFRRGRPAGGSATGTTPLPNTWPSPNHTQPLSAAARMAGDVFLRNGLPAGGTVNGHAWGLPDLAQTCSSSFRSGIGLGQERTPIAAYLEDVPWRPGRCMGAATVKEMDPAQAGSVMLWSASIRYDRAYRSRGQGDDRTCSRTCLRRILPSIERGMSSICTIRRGTL